MEAGQRCVQALAKVPEVARLLGVSRATVYNLMDAGKLSYVKIGSARRVEPEAIQRLIAEHRVGSDPAFDS